MMLLMGNLPTGVCAVNLSCSTSTPFSLPRMYCSSLVCAGLPGGRDPKATTSFTYCMMCSPLRLGLGALGAESAEGVAAGMALVAAAGLTSADAAEGVGCDLSQLTVTAKSASSEAAAMREDKLRKRFMLPAIVNGLAESRQMPRGRHNRRVSVNPDARFGDAQCNCHHERSEGSGFHRRQSRFLAPKSGARNDNS